jgi:peptide chain release factor 1
MEKKVISEKIIEYLNKIEDKFLSQAPVDSKKIVSLLDKKKKHQKMSSLQNEYSELAEQVVSLDEKKVIQSEIDNLEAQKEQLITQIKTELIREEGIEQNVIMEIRPGAGGDEAGL